MVGFVFRVFEGLFRYGVAEEVFEIEEDFDCRKKQEFEVGAAAAGFCVAGEMDGGVAEGDFFNACNSHSGRVVIAGKGAFRGWFADSMRRTIVGG